LDWEERGGTHGSWVGRRATEGGVEKRTVVVSSCLLRAPNSVRSRGRTGPQRDKSRWSHHIDIDIDRPPPPRPNLSLPALTHGTLYSFSIRPSQRDFFLYTQFSRTHSSSISFSIHSIHCGTHLSLYLNISMRDLVLKDLLRRI
jgi:hypothetical protein